MEAFFKTNGCVAGVAKRLCGARGKFIAGNVHIQILFDLIS